MTMPKPGDRAPQFKLKNHENTPISLGDIDSKWVLIYFYPKAMTPGCTTQACALRDAATELARQDITVLGISPDAPDRLKAFRDKERLNFMLLSDNDHSVAEMYGSWVEKSMYGKRYMGMARNSFLVDSDGIVRLVLTSVTPATHLQQVLDWLDQSVTKLV